MSRRRLGAVFAVGAGLCFTLAALTLPRPSSTEYVRRSLSDAVIRNSGTRVSGTIRDRLPAYRLHWDGQPPAAVLVDTRTDHVLAPSVLSEQTLQLNDRAVLWTPSGCEFAINASLYGATGAHLAIDFEVPGSRRTFYGWFALAAGLFALTVLLYVGPRVLFAGSGGRLESLFGYLQTAVFLLAAGAIFFMEFPGYPVNGRFTGDEPNLNSFAAALDRPEVFQRDKLLSQRRNFDWYTPLYVQWVRLFQWVGFRYDTNRAFVLLLSTVIGLFGYQRLFGTLSGSSLFGFAAAVCLWFMKVAYPPDEAWSAVFGAPRTAYSALLPWALLLAAETVERPSRWWLASSVAGLLFYVHPVSSPALTGAVLIGFLVAGRERWRARCGHLLLAAGAAVAVMLPYILTYVGKYDGAAVPDAAVATKALQYAGERFAPGYIDLPIFYSQLSTFLMHNSRYWLGAAAMLLLIPLYRSTWARFFFGALAGFAIVGFLIPFVDLAVAKRLHTLPFQVDLIRNIRYADVIVLSAVALLIGECQRWAQRHRPASVRDHRLQPFGMMRRVAKHGAVVGMLAVLFCYRDLLQPSVGSVLAVSRANVAALQGRLSDTYRSNIEVINALHALRRDTEIVFGLHHFRQAYIPLTFTHKDLGALSYANPYALVQAREAFDRIRPYPFVRIDFRAATELARIMDAQILVLHAASLDPAVLESPAVIFRTDNTVLLRVNDVRVPPNQAGTQGG